MGHDKNSNLHLWQQLQDEGYFENHMYYGKGSGDILRRFPPEADQPDKQSGGQVSPSQGSQFF